MPNRLPDHLAGKPGAPTSRASHQGRSGAAEEPKDPEVESKKPPKQIMAGSGAFSITPPAAKQKSS